MKLSSNLITFLDRLSHSITWTFDKKKITATKPDIYTVKDFHPINRTFDKCEKDKSDKSEFI